MYNYILLDSEYCSMGRWISAIVAEKLNMRLYEEKDLLKYVNNEWLTEDYLNDLYEELSTMENNDEVLKEKVEKVHNELSKAILKVVVEGPCIIHESGASEVLKSRNDCLRVLLYNTNTMHKIPRAKADKTYNIKDLPQKDIVEFIHKEDSKRKNYHDLISPNKWGEKENYDICLDSDLLSREKCAEILVEAMTNIRLDLEECEQIIQKSFVWTK